MINQRTSIICNIPSMVAYICMHKQTHSTSYLTIQARSENRDKCINSSKWILSFIFQSLNSNFPNVYHIHICPPPPFLHTHKHTHTRCLHYMKIELAHSHILLHPQPQYTIPPSPIYAHFAGRIEKTASR